VEIFEDISSLKARLSLDTDFFFICIAATGSFSEIEDFNVFFTATYKNTQLAK